MALTFSAFKKSLIPILSNMPKSWRGTTFNNSNLLSRQGFETNIRSLILEKQSDISTEDLVAAGEAEDYLRVASNVSVLLEMGLALEKGLNVSRVLTFASNKMPFIAVGLVSPGVPVHIYTEAELPFTEEQLATLKHFKCELHQHKGKPEKHGEGELVVLYSPALLSGHLEESIDALVTDNVLYINNHEKIQEAEVLIRRKRLATPLTTPVAEQMLRRLAGLEENTIEAPSTQQLDDFYTHLQQMSGTAVHLETHPVVFTAGLPTIASLWTALAAGGGADIVMASTAYGGSSQLTDLLSQAGENLVKHTFDLQGARGMEEGIRERLNAMEASKNDLKDTTLLMMEVPTNPDMKVPELKRVVDMFKTYAENTQKKVILLVDATFAPQSNVLKQLSDLWAELNAIVFLSMSKSVSRGLTTAGCFVFNHCDEAKALREAVVSSAHTLGTLAKPDQLRILCENHTGVEQRNAKAYQNARTVGLELVASVKKHTGADMTLAFVSDDTAAKGFTTATFSFNLPATDDAQKNAALAQRFVDLIAVHDFVKPCVSFGQDNGLLYATVPATSTQGAIREEDKAKQAQGGVQLTRLSLPPTIDVAAVNKVFDEAVATLYKK